MSKLKEGIRVVVIEDNSLRNGTIKKIYEDLNMAIVDFDDGGTEKVSLSMLAVEPNPIKSEDTKTTEPVEKSEITITPVEFMEITTDILAKESVKGSPIIGIVGVGLLAKIHTALFSIKND